VFSNCDEVELFLNGTSLGRQKPDQDKSSTNLLHPPFTFKAGRFEPGELKAVAFLKGKVAAQHVVKTPGTAKRIDLSLDVTGKPLAAGGDLVFVYARIVDANGTVIPDAAMPVEFAVEGDAQLIGNNSSAEAGISTVLLRTGSNAGAIKLKATAAGLEGSLEAHD
jgi:beta-galactosidase